MDNVVMPTAGTKPGKIQAVAILTLVSGISNILWMIFWGIWISIFGISTVGVGCLLIPIVIPPIVLGVFEIIYSTKILPNPIKPAKPATTLAILEIICILTGNIVAVAAGIVALVMYNDPAVKAYFQEHSI